MSSAHEPAPTVAARSPTPSSNAIAQLPPVQGRSRARGPTTAPSARLVVVEQLPVIDVGPLRELAAAGRGVDDPLVAATAAAIDRACRDTGFFAITGHGIPMAPLAGLDGAARAFFALPEHEKAQIAMVHGGRAWRGWFPEGGELTSGRADRKEGIYFGRELSGDDPRVRAEVPLHGANLFPTPVPELRPAVLDWIEQMTDLGQTVLQGVALGLGLGADWFLRHVTQDPTVLFRIFRYPAMGADDEGWGVAEHTDYGLLTILAHDGSPGLQVRGEAGWIDVDVAPDVFVVNLGDMLDRMTGGRYRSTPHRVRRPTTSRGSVSTDAEPSGPAPGLVAEDVDRLSFPFFLDPSWDAEVRPMTLDDSPPPDDAGSRWDATSVHEWSGTYGDYLTAKVARVFPHLVDGST